MYQFVTGPLLWLSFAVFFIGSLSYLAWVAYLHVDANKRLAMIQSGEWESIKNAQD